MGSNTVVSGTGRCEACARDPGSGLERSSRPVAPDPDAGGRLTMLDHAARPIEEICLLLRR